MFLKHNEMYFNTFCNTIIIHLQNLSIHGYENVQNTLPYPINN